VTVDLHGHDSERFEYDTIRFQRFRASARWSLFDKTYWLTTLPGVPLFYALGPYSLAGFLGATHALELSRWLANSGSRHQLGLHSDDSHRCSQLALPRNAKQRGAILDEFARRFVKELRTRPQDLASLRVREPHPVRGRPVPDFALASLDGAPRSLSQLRGSVVLLNFWASWCEPCGRELPQLQRLHERHSAAGLAVVGVSDEDPSQARQYLEKLGIGYPSLSDVDGSVMQSYRIHAIPTSLIIGRDGQLLRRMEGYTPADAFERALKPLLSDSARDSGP
jgi:peroxiredoxin